MTLYLVVRLVSPVCVLTPLGLECQSKRVDSGLAQDRIIEASGVKYLLCRRRQAGQVRQRASLSDWKEEHGR